MMISNWKMLSWALAGLLGVGLVSYVAYGYQQIRNDPGWAAGEAKALLEGVKEPEPPRDEIVDYEDVKRNFQTFNWTGKQDAKPANANPDAGPPPPPPIKPVSELLRVLFIFVDSDDPAGSLCMVSYKAPELNRPGRLPGDTTLRFGSRLPEPFAHVKVKAIEPEEVVFEFDDEKRAEERVGPPEFGSDKAFIVKVDEGGKALEVEAGARIPASQNPRPFRPRQTLMLDTNTWQIGTEDEREISENWSRMVSDELLSRQHRDPATGKYDGIEISEVKPGSTAAKLGVKSGDVIKSINGHPVNSVQEAINFAKVNNDKYDTWEVVVENQGKTHTLTYKEPPPDSK